MRKSGLFGFLLISAFALLAQGPRGGEFGPMGMGGRGMGMFGGGPRALVTGAPYSAVEVVQTQETLADGNRIVNQHQMTVYRDGQGRIRTEQTITPSGSSGRQPYTIATILDYVGGYRYVLDSSTMTAYQSPLRIPPNASSKSAERPRRVGAPSAQAAQDRPQVVTTSLAPQSVNGVLATGTQHTETIPAGMIGNAQAIQISRVTWISNDLKVPVQIRSSDPRFGTTDMELTNIVQAEPNPSLFVAPAGYSIKTGGRGGPQMRGPRQGPPPEAQ
jgi:hypothetical protein